MVSATTVAGCMLTYKRAATTVAGCMSTYMGAATAVAGCMLTYMRAATVKLDPKICNFSIKDSKLIKNS
ncbi:hypothetical protein LJC05_04360 [Bacteroides sp. OttesenSCG-928-J23]|nr:hypothetical protein [Bacteroides sp. OttesenSCG-928-J23]